MLQILEQLGGKIQRLNKNTLEIDATTVNTYQLDPELMEKMKS